MTERVSTGSEPAAALTELHQLGWSAGRIDWYPSGYSDGVQSFGFAIEIYRTSYQQKFHADTLPGALDAALDYAREYATRSLR